MARRARRKTRRIQGTFLLQRDRGSYSSPLYAGERWGEGPLATFPKILRLYHLRERQVSFHRAFRKMPLTLPLPCVQGREVAALRQNILLLFASSFALFAPSRSHSSLNFKNRLNAATLRRFLARLRTSEPITQC